MSTAFDASRYAAPISQALLEAELKELVFQSFNCDIAFVLGQSIRSTYLKLAASSGILISIRLHDGLTLFQSACGPNVTPNNEDWVRRKANTVREYGLPTLLKRRMLEAKGKDIDSLGRDFAAHGGGYPIIIEHVGPIGVIVVSGLRQEEDHALVTSAVRYVKSTMSI